MSNKIPFNLEQAKAGRGKKLVPKNANTINKICKLKWDNVSTKKSWLLINPGGVNISNQIPGNPATGSIFLTKREFERFIKFYETGS